VVQTPLPIDEFVGDIAAHVRAHRTAVIVAPPGAGKTTRVPPALAAIGRTILLQPRRVAARALARRIADEQGWRIGEEIGWQIRFERRFSERTRLLVATEGILTARLQSDPLLSDFDVIILDEFHERSIHADLALALAKQAMLSRDDLRVVVMSATIAADDVSRFLGGARVFTVGARRHPVDVRYRPGVGVAQAAREQLATARGDLLCFLPGMREIERARGELADLDADVLPLHGSLEVDAQERALAPSTRRKIILATNIAETSLTVEGITDVIDSGVQKVLRFDPETAVDHLVIERIGADSAEQRAGRAGRTQPGRAVRLWDERDLLRPHREPDVRRVDLAAPLLDILSWGGDPRTFEWFERPPEERIEAGMEVLRALGALTRRFAAPSPGGVMDLRAFPLHPRLAKIVLEARGAEEAIGIVLELSGGPAGSRRYESRRETEGRGVGGTPAESRRHVGSRADVGSGGNVESRANVGSGGNVESRGNVELREIEAVARRVLGDSYRRTIDDASLRRALLAGYPDRVAQRREAKSPLLLLSSGTGATLAREIDDGRGEFLVVLDITGDLVRSARPIEREWLVPTRRDTVHELTAGGRVRAVERAWYGAILLHEQSVAPDPEEAARLLATVVQPDEALARRVTFAELEVDWSEIIAGAVAGRTSVDEVRIELPFALRKRLDELAPATIPLPSGRGARLEYRDDGSVVASAKLQELFGLADSPLLGPRRTPVTFALLSPAGRPVQVTRDLKSFWNSGYLEVRKELRGRYPKHPWPDDPWTARATRGTKR
jgi:ATP-dependent helicase HrpB